MKLYATVTSERASKGQGGNKNLDIEIMVYDRFNPLYTLEITDEKLIFRERGYSQPLLERSHKDIKEQEEKLGAWAEQKGNKQKTAKMYCEEHINQLLIIKKDGWRYCPQCKQ